ncbi:DUF2806 domain-containing protein [Bradyrhizobium sp. LLZ17]|uniref:DUF2806 domain-containing protein n=1 Tax=Bradyrhizobium sp. LLZ17 TaxID=3239388 RepID=A0AB39XNI6_9BRAD
MTDLIDFIKSVPGLAKAFTELVGDVGRLGSSIAKLGTTKVDQGRKAIEDQTSRDSALSHAKTESDIRIGNALTKAAAQYIQANAMDLGERALERCVHSMIKHQLNREKVVVTTGEILRLNPPKTTEMPSEDWLNVFGKYAENASSEKMRDHWAYILSGEIRRPGSFSFAALHLASIIDTRIAEKIERFRPWLIGNSIPLIPATKQAGGYDDLLILASIGFLNLGGAHIRIVEDGAEKAEFELEGCKLLVTPKPQVKLGNQVMSNGVSIAVAVVGPAGDELLSVLPPVAQDSRLPELLVEDLRPLCADVVIVSNDESEMGPPPTVL